MNRHSPGNSEAVVRRGSAAGGSIYLTFDDGPDRQWTPRLLDLLAETAVPATFFLIGRQASHYPELLRRMIALGHEVGNHTWSHRHPWTMTTRTARREVRDGATALADILGRQPTSFRPPHGRQRRCMIDEAKATGQTVILWSLSAVDWGPLGSARGIAHRLNTAQAGDIVLMHDGGQGINHPGELAKALPEFLASLSRRGLVPSLFLESQVVMQQHP